MATPSVGPVLRGSAIVVTLALCAIWLMLFWSTEHAGQPTTNVVVLHSAAPQRLPPEDATRDAYPCGDVCTYNADGAQPGKFYPLILRNFNCSNIMARSYLDKPATTWPPPREPPPDLESLFTQNGASPITATSYYAQRYSGHEAMMSQWTEEYVEKERRRAREGKMIGSYDLEDVQNIQRVLTNYSVAGMRGAVFGSEWPWVEALCLNAGAEHVTTIEYGRINCTHPQIDTMTPREAGRAFLLGDLLVFDFFMSFSSLEHSGLGRYGDALNPFGDLEATAQVWCMLRPGGFFFLGVPNSPKSHIRWNADRWYGPERAQFLTAGFVQHELVGGWRPTLHSLYVVQKIPMAVEAP